MAIRKTSVNGSPLGGLDSPRVRAVSVSLGAMSRRSAELVPFGIDVVELNHPEELAADPETVAGWEVLLIHCPLNGQRQGGPPSAARVLLEAAVATGMGICFVLDDTVDSVREWFVAGADAVAFVDQSAALVSLAVFTAHNSGVMRRSFQRRVTDLEKKLEETRLINHAKTLMAKQLNICELDALQKLRKESRSQRRPMVELAKIIIEAHEILTGKMHSPPTPASSLNKHSKVNGSSELKSDFPRVPSHEGEFN